MTEFNLVRTALPVGQGAFYCERFTDDTTKVVHNIVYDCGACDNSKNETHELSSEIKGLLKKGDTIDILFISHFDADHVNGIEQLATRYNINKIVLPEITKNLWYIYALGAYCSQFTVMANFANFLNSHSKQLVEVGPASEEDSFELERDEIDITDYNSNKILPSGTKIRTGKKTNPFFWCYIPMNYTKPQTELDALKANLFNIKLPNGQNLTEEEIKDASIVGKLANEIKDAFTKSKFTTNSTSMVVYSGPSIAKVNFDHSSLYARIRFHKIWNPLCYYYPYWSDSTACLYTGDAVLNSKRCNSISGYIRRIKDNIGILQIPHHGSKSNFSVDNFENAFKLELDDIFCFASYGINNRYRHPSSKVVTDLMLHGAERYGVTEEKDSQFYEHVRISIYCRS